MTAATAMETTEMPPREGIKETLESIVVALILAFVFRAFIVEAFVIPTGSMAPTLFGAHGTLLCEDCGEEFAYGLKDLSDDRRSNPVMSRSRAICPNCNHPNTNLKENDERANPEKGDRILVLKWPFYLSGSLFEPKRWDVIVFKDPADGTTNFIKRLAGLPNEVLMVMDGDVFSVPTKDLSERCLQELENIRHEKYELRTGARSGLLRPVPPFVLSELDKKMTIRRKTEVAQRVLWALVFDNDHRPRNPEAYQPRWEPGRASQTGWTSENSRLSFAAKNDEDDYMELIGKEIRATCAYNIFHLQAPPVSDMRTRFVWTPRSEDASLMVRLIKNDDVFWASLSADGTVKLIRSRDCPTSATRPMASAHCDTIHPQTPVEVYVSNVDYRLSVSVAGTKVIESSDDPTSPAYYAPDLAKLRLQRRSSSYPPRLYGMTGAFDIDHLVVERDEYYYHDTRRRALAMDWAPASGWGSADSPILLRDGEYFMLGDNTAASKDSRLWDQVGPHLQERGEDFQLGTVPRDQLIGKAFFVYWPSGQRLDWLPIPRIKDWGVVPDVGRMRWIR